MLGVSTLNILFPTLPSVLRMAPLIFILQKGSGGLEGLMICPSQQMNKPDAQFHSAGVRSELGVQPHPGLHHRCVSKCRVTSELHRANLLSSLWTALRAQEPFSTPLPRDHSTVCSRSSSRIELTIRAAVVTLMRLDCPRVLGRIGYFRTCVPVPYKSPGCASGGHIFQPSCHSSGG